MARTGPQKIPGASQAYFYGTGRYSGSDMEVNCGVVHTTEGINLPSYNGGAMAPTVTGVPLLKERTLRWYQHYDVDESARALANKLGGVETNTANVFQIELVGTCDDRYATTWSGRRAGVDYLHWPTAPDWALAEVAWLVRWLNQNHGIPLSCVKDWLAYGKDSRRSGITPASYGANPARMTFAEWRSFKGWCGHQHVPENDHGDPGSMNFARVIAIANGQQANTEEDEDMAISDADARKVARMVWELDGFFAVPWGTKENPEWAPESVLRHVGEVARESRGRIKEMQATVGALSGVVSQLAEGGGLDAAEIQAAAEAGARAALERLGETLTDQS